MAFRAALRRPVKAGRRPFDCACLSGCRVMAGLGAAARKVDVEESIIRRLPLAGVNDDAAVIFAA